MYKKIFWSVGVLEYLLGFWDELILTKRIFSSASFWNTKVTKLPSFFHLSFFYPSALYVDKGRRRAPERHKL